MHDHDTLHRFLFEHHDVKGAVVQLSHSYQALLRRQTYPETIKAWLGEALSAVCLLMSTIKINGHLTLQVQSQGGVSLLVVECNHRFHLRGLVKFDEAQGVDTWQAAFSQAYLAMTITPEAGQPYQGIVPLTEEMTGFAEALEAYFYQSEQLLTRIWLSCDGVQTAGFMLQQLPQTTADADETWVYVTQMAQTLTAEEMLSLDCTTLLHRLYHEVDVRLFDGEPIAFRCRCSREKMATALSVLSAEELRSIVQEEENVQLQCEYCGQQWGFDPVDVEEILHQTPSVSTKTGLQ